MNILKWRHICCFASLLTLIGASAASAQEAGQPEAAAQEASQPEVGQEESVVGLEPLRVIGSRVPRRSVQDSPVPVDLIQGEDFQTYGIRDMDSLLSAAIPSYNTRPEFISDEATFVRPAALRGLPPDSTLVLVNGKRRHRAGAIAFLGHPSSRGAHGTDISSIPAIALERVEVLRDGASAQYGSDAIAGVMNFKLREDTEGLSVHTSIGQTYHGDGDRINVAANLGVPLTERGFANFSFEFNNVDETNRDTQRRDARELIEAGNTHIAGTTQRWGIPEVRYDYKFFGNLGLDLEEINSRLYAFGNYAEREMEGGFYWRNPNNRGGIFAGDPLEDGTPTVKVVDVSHDGRSGGCRDAPIRGNIPQFGEVANGPDCFSFAERFPGGFTPHFGATVRDWSIAFGLTGTLESEYSLLNGWYYDVSAYFGENSVDYFIRETINPQLVHQRMAIPTEYRPGTDVESEKTFNLDISRPVDLGIFHSPLNMAFGFEYHIEEYEVELGGENSWYFDADRLGHQGLGVGSNGFTGFGPAAVSDDERKNYALYMDLESEVIRSVTLGVAGRYENFDDPIGESVNGKVSARWQVLEMLALRGALSSGFRAPTAGQLSVNKVLTSVQGGKLVDEGIYPAHHPAALLLGSNPLTPEKSVNYSAGIVFSLADVEVTVDYFRIKMQDRIAMSSSLDVNAELASRGLTRAQFDEVVGPNQISALRFFTNDFDTTTQGVDVVATYPLQSIAGLTRFSLVGNWTDTKIDKRSPDVIYDELAWQIEEGVPEFRFTLTADHSYGPWRFLTRLHFYDNFRDLPIEFIPMRADESLLVDMELSYTFMNLPFMDAATIALGAENLFDHYPSRPDNKHPFSEGYGGGDFGLKYAESSPYGFNGGFYYLRAGFEF